METKKRYPSDGEWRCGTCTFFDESEQLCEFGRKKGFVVSGVLEWHLPPVSPDNRCADWKPFDPTAFPDVQT